MNVGEKNTYLVEKYDIVIARVYIKALPGRMNSFNKNVNHSDFPGYGIIIESSDSFCLVYLSNRTLKLFKKENLIVVSKFN